MKKYQIRKQAAHIRKFIGTPSLDTMSRYAAFLGFTVVYDTENISPAAEFVDLNNHIICITNKIDEPTANHLLAHALGHIVLNHKRIFADETPQENEANYFAQCLLKNNRRLLFILSAILLIIALISCVGLSVQNTPNQTIPYQNSANLHSTQTVNQVNQPKNIKQENVVVTKSGEKYHLPSCYHVKNKSDTITLSLQEAENANYTPCKTCFGE